MGVGGAVDMHPFHVKRINLSLYVAKGSRRLDVLKTAPLFKKQ